MDDILGDLSGIERYFDDVLIYIKDQMECYNSVIQILERFKKLNVKVEQHKVPSSRKRSYT